MLIGIVFLTQLMKEVIGMGCLEMPDCLGKLEWMTPMDGKRCMLVVKQDNGEMTLLDYYDSEHDTLCVAKHFIKCVELAKAEGFTLTTSYVVHPAGHMLSTIEALVPWESLSGFRRTLTQLKRTK
jgi:hypothetical protein